MKLQFCLMELTEYLISTRFDYAIFRESLLRKHQMKSSQNHSSRKELGLLTVFSTTKNIYSGHYSISYVENKTFARYLEKTELEIKILFSFIFDEGKPERVYYFCESSLI